MSQDDKTTTIWQLRQEMAQFVAERDWQDFHDPKNLAMAIAIEAAELMEHFQWLTNAESQEPLRDPGRQVEIADELADITCFVLSFANTCGIDIAEAVRRKMHSNRKKYPAERFRGRFR